MAESPHTLTELKQRYLSERREFYLQPDQIRLYIKDLSGEVEEFVDYEKLTTKTRRLVSQDAWVYVTGISFAVFATVGVLANLVGYSLMMRWVPFWGLVSVIMFGFHFYKRRSYLLVDLDNGKAIFFLNDRFSQKKLPPFLLAMNQARATYLRKTYFKVSDPPEPGADLRRFEWLRKEGIISGKEYDDARAALAGRLRPNPPEEDRRKGAIH